MNYQNCMTNKKISFKRDVPNYYHFISRVSAEVLFQISETFLRLYLYTFAGHPINSLNSVCHV